VYFVLVKGSLSLGLKAFVSVFGLIDGIGVGDCDCTGFGVSVGFAVSVGTSVSVAFVVLAVFFLPEDPMASVGFAEELGLAVSAEPSVSPDSVVPAEFAASSVLAVLPGASTSDGSTVSSVPAASAGLAVPAGSAVSSRASMGVGDAVFASVAPAVENPLKQDKAIDADKIAHINFFLIISLIPALLLCFMQSLCKQRIGTNFHYQHRLS